jgi:hypothetical protein
MDGTTARAVLGVSPQAGQREIQAAFRTLAKNLHPDRHQGDALAFRRLVEARSALTEMAAHATAPHTSPVTSRSSTGSRQVFLDVSDNRPRPTPRSCSDVQPRRSSTTAGRPIGTNRRSFGQYLEEALAS